MNKDIVMLPLDSSLLKAHGYNGETNILRLRFNPSKKQAEAGHPGPMFDYAAPVEFHGALTLLAKYGGSVGKFFLAEIKPQFVGTPVDAPKAEEAAA